jgi:hypothetical protein
MTRKSVVVLLFALSAIPARVVAAPSFIYRPAPGPPTTEAGWAEQYEEEAAKWRGEAAHQRQMAIDYRRFSKSPANPAIPKMEQHYAAMAKAADQRAAEAERLAEYHRQRAKGS